MQRARKFLYNLGKKGDIISDGDFINAMQEHISMDKHRVQKPYFDLMLQFKLIEKTENGVKINV